ncbi:hypothetical protein DUE52_02920 [Larkinella punicea]|uniref:Uncharacterized protein n=1 Tax=Larkinella punicea TaxID=2315727 RepID=A0A368JU87_9BACT|nr:hypothetical protein DUE52_02920 [Larkinella punicea]
MAVGVVCLQDKFTPGSGLGERVKTAIYGADCDNHAGFNRDKITGKSGFFFPLPFNVLAEIFHE